MRLHRLPVLLLPLVLAAPLGLRAKDKKPSVPEVFGRARMAYVEAVDGQQFDRGLDPEERNAIADVQDALQAWKRYVLVTQREQADIVFVVRKGRAYGGNLDTDSGSVPGGWGPAGPGGAARQQQPMAPASPGVGPDFREDLLEVCLVNANGKLSNPLWERRLEDGLNPPQMLLFRQFRDEVDKAYPSPPASQGQQGSTPPQ